MFSKAQDIVGANGEKRHKGDDRKSLAAVAQQQRHRADFGTGLGWFECHNKVDRVTRTDLADCLRQLNEIIDEAERLLEQRRLQDEEVWKMVEQNSVWKLGRPTEKNIDSIAERTWQMTQSSDTTGKEPGTRLGSEHNTWNELLIVLAHHE